MGTRHLINCDGCKKEVEVQWPQMAVPKEWFKVSITCTGRPGSDSPSPPNTSSLLLCEKCWEVHQCVYDMITSNVVVDEVEKAKLLKEVDSLRTQVLTLQEELTTHEKLVDLLEIEKNKIKIKASGILADRDSAWREVSRLKEELRLSLLAKKKTKKRSKTR